ncbi:MAG: hypothetical protein ACR2GQ_06170 [Gemmatimonadota bacterium]|jgi:hypothetical protein
MRRIVLAAAAAAVLATGPPEADGRTARDPEAECTAYCGDLAARRCDDVTSNWCNAYIVGCLAGCGIAHL